MTFSNKLLRAPLESLVKSSRTRRLTRESLHSLTGQLASTGEFLRSNQEIILSWTSSVSEELDRVTSSIDVLI